MKLREKHLRRMIKTCKENTMDDTKKKELALFYLNRVVKQAEEAASFDHVRAAESGMGYATRKAAAADAEDNRAKAEALRWAFTKLNEMEV